MCVCERESERESDRERGGGGEKERKREREGTVKETLVKSFSPVFRARISGGEHSAMLFFHT